MLPFEATFKPPLPRLVLPRVSGVLSTTVAPAPLNPTDPPNSLAGLASVTVPVPAPMVAFPVTIIGPPDWVMPPCALFAARLPPTVVAPSASCPPAVVVRFPVVLIGPRISAPVSAIATEPLIG